MNWSDYADYTNPWTQKGRKTAAAMQGICLALTERMAVHFGPDYADAHAQEAKRMHPANLASWINYHFDLCLQYGWVRHDLGQAYRAWHGKPFTEACPLWTEETLTTAIGQPRPTAGKGRPITAAWVWWMKSAINLMRWSKASNPWSITAIDSQSYRRGDGTSLAAALADYQATPWKWEQSEALGGSFDFMNIGLYGYSVIDNFGTRHYTIHRRRIDIHLVHPAANRFTGQFHAYIRTRKHNGVGNYLNRDTTGVQEGDVWLMKTLPAAAQFQPIGFAGDELGIPDIRQVDLNPAGTIAGWSAYFGESSSGGQFGLHHKCYWRWDLPGGFSFLD